MHTLLKPLALGDLNSASASANSQVKVPRTLSARLRQQLVYRHIQAYDWQQGGLKYPIKFLDRDSIEYSLSQAAAHDRNEERMVRLYLDRGLELLDPSDGGIYQFATQNCWYRAHYAKTMAAQAGSLRLYVLAYALFREFRYLQAARSISNYLNKTLLTKEGVFKCEYESPVQRDHRFLHLAGNVNTAVSTRENGWAIEALGAMYEYCADDQALEHAIAAEQWINAHRRSEDGTYTTRTCTLSLGDNLAMARACLQLYRCTGERCYLDRSCATADAIGRYFFYHDGGFSNLSDRTMDDQRRIDENICLSRYYNLLASYSGQSNYLSLARHGLAWLARPEVANARMEEAGILLLDEELNSTPLSIRIMPETSLDRHQQLLRSALRQYGWYKVIHWSAEQSSKV